METKTFMVVDRIRYNDNPYKHSEQIIAKGLAEEEANKLVAQNRGARKVVESEIRKINDLIRLAFLTRENEYFRLYTECKLYFTWEGEERFVGYANRLYPQMSDETLLNELLGCGRLKNYAWLVKSWEYAKK